MNYDAWTERTDAELQGQDIARWNLSLAAGLPGGEALDVDALCRKLDTWAERVRDGTRPLRLYFDRHPHKFGRSPARFRLMAMLTIVQRDLGVRYDPSCMHGDYDARDCRPWFVHGPLSGDGGTCVSLPMLFLALGRRLGYPLFLCEGASHLFVRWDGDGERLNVECTARGYRRDAETDDHFRCYPVPMPRVLERSGCMLRNCGPRETLAQMLLQRSHCLFDNFRWDEARAAAAAAEVLFPGHPVMRGMRNVTTMAAELGRDLLPRLRAGSRPPSISIHPRRGDPSWRIEAAQPTAENVNRVLRLHRADDYAVFHQDRLEPVGR